MAIDHINNMFQNPYDIASCFINYFRNLFTSSDPSLDILPPLRSNFENMTDCRTMPNKEEILRVHKGMKQNASPGRDGTSLMWILLSRNTMQTDT